MGSWVQRSQLENDALYETFIDRRKNACISFLGDRTIVFFPEITPESSKDVFLVQFEPVSQEENHSDRQANHCPDDSSEEEPNNSCQKNNL